MSLQAIQNRMNDADVAFIHDPDGNVHYWKLRSLPAINYLGTEHATYPTSWRQLKHTWQHERGGRQYDFPGYDYHVSGGIQLPPSEDLCVVTTSYYEKNTQYTMNDLVNRYASSEGSLIVVADERRFQPSGGLRPLYHEPFCRHIGRYDRVYEAFVEHYESEGWVMPLRDTKNLFVQDNANLYELVEDDTVETTSELFDELTEAPYLPLYEAFSNIFARRDELGVSPLESDDVIEAFGGWLRRRIEWDKSTASEIAHDLNRSVSMEGTTFDPSYAKRSPKIRLAREAAKDLPPETSPIDTRYHDWLMHPL
ncbi:hypothetical protein C464_05440 [Halorubrum coriense DSM 10284]|uniref:Uncharacterized protein n=1 Tax=Halorubrum coriense DSM 10284 TaxID=1227466 RepID=M0EP01_9EURY|nr:hypothetical protein [Halorubrum coriense]ELZ48828.1 hypothetical protein C464_05440 [Halorubrum coriense DSM 10284]